MYYKNLHSNDYQRNCFAVTRAFYYEIWRLQGIRDEGLMESAVARPYQTFGGEDLCPGVFEKAAVVAESLIINHPFVDGNKRTGYLAMLAILEEGKIEITVSNEMIYRFIIEISTGEKRFEEIVEWLKQNTTSF